MTDLLLSTFLQTLKALDTSVFLAVNGCHSDYWDNFMEMFSGRYIWLPLYLSIVYVMFRSFHWKVNVACLLVVALLIAINDQTSGSLLRSTVGRLRPANLDNPISPMVHIVDGYRGGRYGFPSAHAANCWGLAFFMYYVFRRHLLTFTLMVWAVVTCWSRMYLGVHYFGDILVGMLLGLASASLVYYVFQRSLHRVTETFKPYQLDAPQMYVPVIVFWSEMALMLILAFHFNASTDSL